MTAKKRKVTKENSDTEKLEKMVDELETELCEKTKQADEYLDHLKRMKAEFENYKKRVQKDIDHIKEHAKEDLIVKLLDIVDNFDRAMEHADGVKDIESFVNGIKMIQTQLIDLLLLEGVQVIEAVGKQFDPTVHEAVMCVSTEDYPDNSVIDEIKRGYFLKEKVIRPSMVRVAKNE